MWGLECWNGVGLQAWPETPRATEPVPSCPMRGTCRPLDADLLIVLHWGPYTTLRGESDCSHFIEEDTGAVGANPCWAGPQQMLHHGGWARAMCGDTSDAGLASALHVSPALH